jgi:hypothetical protein
MPALLNASFSVFKIRLHPQKISLSLSALKILFNRVKMMEYWVLKAESLIDIIELSLAELSENTENNKKLRELCVLCERKTNIRRPLSTMLYLLNK